MVHLAPLLLLTSLCMVVSGLGTAAPEKRDFKGVQSSLDTIITQAGVVKGKVASFPNSGGKLPQAVAIQGAADTLIQDVKKASNVLKSTSNFSKDQGNQISNKIDSKLYNVVDATLKAIAGKKQAFDNIGVPVVRGLVVAKLRELLAAMTDLGNALVKHAPPDQQSRARTIQGKFQNIFGNAIKALEK